jgi:uncharacterized protein (DUF2249 family)
MSPRTVTLDVREDLAQGREPLGRILAQARTLKPGQALRVVAPFEPTPLYGVLAGLGFAHRTTQTASGAWEVRFERGSHPIAAEPAASAPPPPECASPPPDAECIELDARGLEPPQPMVAILEALPSVPEGATLRVRTDRRPMRLYPQLELRGYAGQTQEQPDGSFITLIRRR